MTFSLLRLSVGDQISSVGASGASPPPTARAGAATSALTDLVHALEAGDTAAAADVAPETDAAARGLLAALADNASSLRLDRLSARYVDAVGAVAPDGSWTAVVELTWAIKDFDQKPANIEILVDFVADIDGVAITGLGGGDRPAPLWLRGPLAVRRTPTALVMAAGHQAELRARDYLRHVRGAIPPVRRVLPRWRPSLVVEVPASAADLDDILGVADGTYAGIAAVTAPADGSTRTDAPVRVLVNPEVTGQLQRSGARLVITHEAVHVATDATTRVLAPWLLEGFADYVALRDVALPTGITAARARALVRRDGVPVRLPGPAKFDIGAPDLDAAYELAWLACVEVAAQVGERGLVEVYEAASGGAGTAEAVASMGLTKRQVLSGWHRRLSRLAS